MSEHDAIQTLAEPCQVCGGCEWVCAEAWESDRQRLEAAEKGEWAKRAAKDIVRTMRYAIENSFDPQSGRTGYSDEEEAEGFIQVIMREFRAALAAGETTQGADDER